MRIIKKNFYLIITLLIIMILAGGGTFVLDRLFHLDSYKDQLLAELQQAINRKVTYEKGSFSFRFEPMFTFSRIAIQEKDGSSNFVTADRLTFRIALLPLLSKKVVLKEMVLDKPQISLKRDTTGSFNISDLLEEKPGETPLQLKGIRIRKGRVHFQDWSIPDERVTIDLEETDLAMTQMVRGKTCSFKLSSNLPGGGKTGIVSLSGSCRLADPGKPLSESNFDAILLVKNLDADRYWPYYKPHVPFRKVLGRLDMDATFKGRLQEFTSRGTVKIAGLRFDYPSVFHALLTPRMIRFNYDMGVSSRDVTVKNIDLEVDGLKVRGSCGILDIPSGDPRIVAQATMTPFRLEDFHQYIPYGIIARSASEYIEQHIKGGTYKLDYGRLDGRASQIAHMEKGTNYNVLAIRGTVEKGLVTYGGNVPTFNNVKGELELKGKDFILHGMTANFGGSPFTLEGKIADYPLDSPSSYPFEMTMTPKQAELAWLMGQETGRKLVFSGESKLRLSGDGYTDGYRLSGEWNLTPASYSYPDLVSKPAGRLNLLSFKSSIDKQEARLSSLQYNLAPMSLAISAGYRFNGKKQLNLSVKSNQFLINEVSSALPAIGKYLPTGKLQAAVRGESPTGNVTDLKWGGALSFTGFSFKPSDHVKTITNMNGTVNLNGTSLETSQLVARLGSSTIYCRGSLAGFKNPTVSLAFSAPVLDMADLGLHAPDQKVIVTRVHGNISLKENNLQIKSLSGQVGTSSAAIRGTIHDLDNPKIDIAVTSPHLDLKDIMLLMELEKPPSKSPHRGSISLKAFIRAETGRIEDVEFEKLSTTVFCENRIVYVQPLDMSVFGGHASGKCRFDLGSNGSPPRYQLSYALDKVSLDRFVRAFGIKPEVMTGTLFMQGELTARGNNSFELKRSALGSVKVRCDKGVIRKFAILSKIFSILNVSQLFRLQFPDMVAGGMPYNSINGNFSIQDGIASTQDFFIASNAMNISAIGRVDLARNDVDATIGVQPLQSVEKVVNRLPVVGWILSGGKKSFLTTYFEAKGKLEDPVVKAIPVSSMAKGVLNIFKRVFELPGKIITDTGEVLIGN